MVPVADHAQTGLAHPPTELSPDLPGEADDTVVFIDEADDETDQQGSDDDWVLLVVDDEPGVHAVTRIALKGLRFRGRGLRVLSAFSATEALRLLSERQDVAVILLDVIMESDDAGLQCVRAIREDLGNHAVRIILRTGQPGQAPEQEVVLNHDINDYKAKNELTAPKLFSTIITALRSYEHITALESSRHGLELIIDSAADLFVPSSLEQFHAGILMQLQALLDIGDDSLLCMQRPGSSAAPLSAEGIMVLGATGRYRRGQAEGLERMLTPAQLALVHASFLRHACLDGHGITTLYIAPPGAQRPDPRPVVAVLERTSPLPESQRTLLEEFAAKAALGMENLYRIQGLMPANRAALALLAQLAQGNDPRAAGHGLAVANLAEAMVRHMAQHGPYRNRVDRVMVELLGLAALLHDVGHAVVPRSVLDTPGPLGPEDWAKVRTHASAGADILDQGARIAGQPGYFSLGTEVALHHHEHWDGRGYPLGLAGDAIPLAARIVTVADVFDALISPRPHRAAWTVADAVDHIRAQAGRQFDPSVVQAFLAVLDDHLVWRRTLKGVRPDTVCPA